jgi:hypothetical protein
MKAFTILLISLFLIHNINCYELGQTQTWDGRNICGGAGPSCGGYSNSYNTNPYNNHYNHPSNNYITTPPIIQDAGGYNNVDQSKLGPQFWPFCMGKDCLK